jgi:NADPH-dependent dioxygenase
MREERTEALVVGAGPVGLLSALLLAEAGVQVTIIDREQRTASRSYACALHPQTLELLHKLGMAESLAQRGRRMERLAFYDREQERVAVDLSGVGGAFPFVLTLAQSELEKALEERLARAGVSVKWNHRLRELEQDAERVQATIEELAGTSTGYIVPHWEMVVKNQHSLQAQFVIGADGANSTVRQSLGIKMEPVRPAMAFAAFEFEAADRVADELRVVLDETTNVLWPLPANRARWTFELLHAEMAKEFPEKERRAARLAEPEVDARIRAYIEKAAKRRAPWFKSAVKDIAWCTEVTFEGRVVKEFGVNRCWLAGDAAHQTGPVGVQSMNSGMLEAAALAEAIGTGLRQENVPDALGRFGEEQGKLWKHLLGSGGGGLRKRPDTDPWVAANADRILPCLPVLGPRLEKLAAGLKLDWLGSEA